MGIRKKAPARARKKVAPVDDVRLEKAVLGALDEVQNGVDFPSLEAACQVGSVAQALEATWPADAEAVFSRWMLPELQRLIRDAEEEELRQLPSQIRKDDAPTFTASPPDQSNAELLALTLSPVVSAIAAQQVATMLQGLAANSRQALLEILGRVFSFNIPARDRATWVMAVAGLNRTQSIAVITQAEAAWAAAAKNSPLGRPKGPSGAAVGQGALRYAEQLRRQRARLVASTEAQRSRSLGQEAAWDSAQRAGWFSFLPVTQEWVSKKDSLVDGAICGPMNGQRVALGSSFVTAQGWTLPHPPAHPHCRCRRVLRFDLQPWQIQKSESTSVLKADFWLTEPRDAHGKWIKGAGLANLTWKKLKEAGADKRLIVSYKQIYPNSHVSDEQAAEAVKTLVDVAHADGLAKLKDNYPNLGPWLEAELKKLPPPPQAKEKEVATLPAIKKVKGQWPAWKDLSPEHRQAMVDGFKVAFPKADDELAEQQAHDIYGMVTGGATASGFGGYQQAQKTYGVKSTKAIHDVLSGKATAPAQVTLTMKPTKPTLAPSSDPLQIAAGAPVADTAKVWNALEESQQAALIAHYNAMYQTADGALVVEQHLLHPPLSNQLVADEWKKWLQSALPVVLAEEAAPSKPAKVVPGPVWQKIWEGEGHGTLSGFAALGANYAPESLWNAFIQQEYPGFSEDGFWQAALRDSPELVKKKGQKTKIAHNFLAAHQQGQISAEYWAENPSVKAYMATVSKKAPAQPEPAQHPGVSFANFKEFYAGLHPEAKDWSGPKWQSAYASMKGAHTAGKSKDPVVAAWFDGKLPGEATTPEVAAPEPALPTKIPGDLVKLMAEDFQSGKPWPEVMKDWPGYDSAAASQAVTQHILMSTPAPDPGPDDIEPTPQQAPDNYIPAFYSTLAGFKPISGPSGSQPGQWYDDGAGHQFYAKPAKSAAHAYNEAGGLKVYEAAGLTAGVDFPHVHVLADDSDPDQSKWTYYVVSQKIEGLHGASATEWAGNPQAKADAVKFFAVNALLSHYDAAGLAMDNTLMTSDSKAVLIEAGGSMQFRAQGSHKPTWKENPTEEETWAEVQAVRGLGPVSNANMKALFGDMSSAEIASSLQDLDKAWDNGQFTQLLKDIGMPQAQRQALYKVIDARLIHFQSIAAKLKGPVKLVQLPPVGVVPGPATDGMDPHDWPSWGLLPDSAKAYLAKVYADEYGAFFANPDDFQSTYEGWQKQGKVEGQKFIGKALQVLEASNSLSGKPTSASAIPAWSDLTNDQKKALVKAYSNQFGWSQSKSVDALVTPAGTWHPDIVTSTWLQAHVPAVVAGGVADPALPVPTPSPASLTAAPPPIKKVGGNYPLWEMLTQDQQENMAAALEKAGKKWTSAKDVYQTLIAPSVASGYSGYQMSQKKYGVAATKAVHGVIQGKYNPFGAAIPTPGPGNAGPAQHINLPPQAPAPVTPLKTLPPWYNLHPDDQYALLKTVQSKYGVLGLTLSTLQQNYSTWQKGGGDPQIVEWLKEWLAGPKGASVSVPPGGTLTPGEDTWSKLTADQRAVIVMDYALEKGMTSMESAQDDVSLMLSGKLEVPIPQQAQQFLQSLLDKVGYKPSQLTARTVGAVTEGKGPQAATEKAPDWVGKATNRGALPPTMATFEEVRGALAAGQVNGLHGWAVAFDSGRLEDLNVRVVKMKRKDGQEGYLLRFKIDQVAHAALAADPGWKSSGFQDFELARKEDTLVETPVGEGGQSLRNVSVKGHTRTRIEPWGEIRAHNTPAYKAADMTVQVFINKDQFSDATVKLAAERLHVVPDYPGPAELRALAEARLLYVFKPKAAESGDPAVRKAALKAIEKAWKVTPDDITIGHDASGQIETYLPDHVVQKLMADYSVNAFVHNVQGGSLEDILLDPGHALRSTTERYTEGVGVHGMSSAADVGTGGGEYVFLRHTQFGQIDTSSTKFVIDASRLLRRMDWFAYSSDSYGTTTKEKYLSRSLSALSHQGGSQETMVKRRLGYEDVEYVVAYDPVQLIQTLRQKGMETWVDGRPLEEVIVGHGATLVPRGQPKVLTAVPKALQPWTPAANYSNTGPSNETAILSPEWEPKALPAWKGTWTKVGAPAQYAAGEVTGGGYTGVTWKWHPEVVNPGSVLTSAGGKMDTLAAPNSQYKLFGYIGSVGAEPAPFMAAHGQWKLVGKKPSGYKWGWFPTA